MGNAAIKGADMAVAMTGKAAAGVKSQAARQAEQTDDGFQKLLDSKSKEDAGTRETDSGKKDDSKEVTKEEAPKKPDSGEETEETTVSADGTALEQVQAALLFGIQPEAEMQETVPEETAELVVETGAAPLEELTELTPSAELTPQQTVQMTKEQPAIPEEALAADVKPEQAVLPKEDTSEKSEAGIAMEKPKEAPKAEAKKEPETEVRPEQVPESTHAEAQATERTAAVKEVPTEHVRVSQPEEIPEKVLNQLLVKSTAGIREFEIQLEPYDLGKIIIKAAFGKEHTSISILCTEQRTMELMAKNARELGAIMEDNLGTPTTIVVEDKETGYLDQQKQNNEGSGDNQNRDGESGKKGEKNQEKEGMDFLQQLRLGLI